MFPICYHPMCCILAFRTTGSYLPCGTQRRLLRYALSANLQGSDGPRGSIPGSVAATKSGVTWESHVFQVCSSPVATQSDLPLNPLTSGGAPSHLVQSNPGAPLASPFASELDPPLAASSCSH